jgi:hypothetical protein
MFLVWTNRSIEQKVELFMDTENTNRAAEKLVIGLVTCIRTRAVPHHTQLSTWKRSFPQKYRYLPERLHSITTQKT